MAKHTSSPDDFRVQESAVFQTKEAKLDRKNSVLKGVKVLGWKSVKGRIYDRDAVEAAASLYDGAKVNLNHAASDGSDFSPPNVKVQDRFGRLRKPRVTNDGLFADLHYNPAHIWAGTFEWFADNEPDVLGLSHDAILRGPMDGAGNRVIRAIPKVFSVDLVADPGSTKGLHEGAADTDGEKSKADDAEVDASVDMDDLDAFDDGDDATDEHREKIAELIRGYVCDAAIDKKQLRDKVLAALDLIDEGESSEDEPNPEKDKESMSTKTDDNKPEATHAGQESAVIDPKEFNALRDQVTKLSTELTESKKLNEDFRAKEDARNDREKAKSYAKDKGIPDKLITDLFLDQMVRATESGFDGVIADRKIQSGLSVKSPTQINGGDSTPAYESFAKSVFGGSK